MENDKTFELITKMYNELTTKMDTMNTTLTARMDTMNTELTTRMDTIQNDVTALKTDVKNLETKMDQRFDSLILGIADLVTKDIVTQIFAKIDDLERSLAVVELVSSKNMSDIATLKLTRLKEALNNGK